MEPSDVLRFIGRPLSDLYGRHVGLVAGFSLKTTGEVESIGVDSGSGSFEELRSDRLILYDASLIVIPGWKAELIRITGETGVLRKRLLALQELGKDPATPSAKAQYEQLGAQYRGRLAKVRESTGKLLQEIKTRAEELDRDDQAIERFMVNVGVQFRSGEVSEAAFGLVSDYCGRLKAKNSKESEELASARAILTQSGGFEIEEKEVAPPPQPARRKPEDPASRDSVRGFVSLEMGSEAPF